MRISWTSDASDDLERIAEVLARDRPDAAFRTARTIYEGIAFLETHPNRGRSGWVKVRGNWSSHRYPTWPCIA